MEADTYLHAAKLEAQRAKDTCGGDVHAALGYLAAEIVMMRARPAKFTTPEDLEKHGDCSFDHCQWGTALICPTTLYLSRYNPRRQRDELERARITNCIRECFPATDRIDPEVPAVMRECREAKTNVTELLEVIASERRMMGNLRHRYELEQSCNSAAQTILRSQGWTWSEATGWHAPVKPENDPTSGRYVPLKLING